MTHTKENKDMKTISLAAALVLVSSSAFADGLYLRPDGYWRAMPQPTYCCSCEFNPTPCGYGRGPPPPYAYGPPPPVAYYGPPPIDPGLAIAGAILSVAPIITGAIANQNRHYAPRRRW